MKTSTRKLVMVAMTAGVYAAATIFMAPISYGALQLRLSEIMTLLAFIDPIFVPGLVLGCVISNLFSPFGMIDVVVGSTATFLAVYMISKSKNLFVASLWPTIFNGLIIGAEIFYLTGTPLLLNVLYIALGEFLVVTLIGYPVFKMIVDKNVFRFFKIEDY